MKHLHEKLGISFAELGALLGTRELLKRGLLGYVVSTANAPDGPGHLFNMSRAIVTNDSCGTVSCIGGTMGILMGKMPGEVPRFVDQYGPLRNLFYPDMSLYRGYGDLQPKQAIAAIDLFLAGHTNPWKTLYCQDLAARTKKAKAKSKAAAKGRKVKARK